MSVESFFGMMIDDSADGQGELFLWIGDWIVDAFGFMIDFLLIILIDNFY